MFDPTLKYMNCEHNKDLFRKKEKECLFFFIQIQHMYIHHKIKFLQFLRNT